jgi:hypothetical protein
MMIGARVESCQHLCSNDAMHNICTSMVCIMITAPLVQQSDTKPH